MIDFIEVLFDNKTTPFNSRTHMSEGGTLKWWKQDLCQLMLAKI